MVFHLECKRLHLPSGENEIGNDHQNLQNDTNIAASIIQGAELKERRTSPNPHGEVPGNPNEEGDQMHGMPGFQLELRRREGFHIQVKHWNREQIQRE